MIPVLPECRDPKRTFCSLCREKEKGRGFRTTILTVRGIEQGPDFVCPLGRPWDGEEASSSRVGSNFHSLLAAKYGVPTCQKCAEMVDRMNFMSVDECTSEKTAILEDIWNRRDALTGWRGLAARLPGAKHVALQELGKLFDKALEA